MLDGYQLETWMMMMNFDVHCLLYAGAWTPDYTDDKMRKKHN